VQDDGSYSKFNKEERMSRQCAQLEHSEAGALYRS